VKGTQAGEVLRASFLQLDVVTDYANDVGLLLQRLLKVVGRI
jgi:hypothetical protein